MDKIRILNAIKEHTTVFRKVSAIRYRIRCPFCGDSQKDITAAHMYLKSDSDPTSPILYYCFKGNCGAKGMVDEEFLKLLNINPKDVGGIDIKKRNILSSSRKDFRVDVGKPFIGPQFKYLNQRLGIDFNEEELDKFKIVWDMEKLSTYVISNIKNKLIPNISAISFLSTDNRSILSRFYHDGNIRWLKQRLDNSEDKMLYTIKSMIDIMSSDKITVVIAEGVFDILSIYHNYYTDNSVYIATLGNRYEDGISFVLDKGIFGNNVDIHIYADNNIKISHIKSVCKKYSWLYNKIIVFKNIKDKDFGVPKDRIELISEEL